MTIDDNLNVQGRCTFRGDVFDLSQILPGRVSPLGALRLHRRDAG
jgi:hypothetical protein